MIFSFTETFASKGEELVDKIKELVAEGTARKITIHDKEGKEIISFPLAIGAAIGVAATVVAPRLAAVAALAALLTECKISVEREKEDESLSANP